MYKSKVICETSEYCLVNGCVHKTPHLKRLSCKKRCEHSKSPFGGGHTCKEYKDPLFIDVDELFEDIEL